MKIRLAIPENGCLVFFWRTEKNKKQKEDKKTKKRQKNRKKTSVEHIRILNYSLMIFYNSYHMQLSRGNING